MALDLLWSDLICLGFSLMLVDVYWFVFFVVYFVWFIQIQLILFEWKYFNDFGSLCLCFVVVVWFRSICVDCCSICSFMCVYHILCDVCWCSYMLFNVISFVLIVFKFVWCCLVLFVLYSVYSFWWFYMIFVNFNWLYLILNDIIKFLSFVSLFIGF